MSVSQLNPFRIGSQTIHSVLDGIVEISQIDPSWVQPDHSFSRDLELSSEQIHQIGLFASRNLNLQLSKSDQAEFQSTRTPREMVQKIESLLQKAAHLRAG